MYKKIYLIFIIFSFIFISIGYAINSSHLNILSSVDIASQDGIFITECVYDSSNNANILESKVVSFYGTTINFKVVLSDSNDSFIRYKIRIYNKNNFVYKFQNVIYADAFYDNQNIVFGLTNLDESTKIDPNSFIDFFITFSYKDTYESNILNAFIGFNFKMDKTYMENTLINNYVPSGNVDDINYLDIESMSNEQRKEKFGNISTEKEIYTIKGINNKTVIILRGNYNDNYVLFGGFRWRILQIDENGNLRLILDDVINNLTSKFNDSSSSDTVELSKDILSYGSSKIKPILDNWFQNNLSYSDKIVKSSFCTNFDYYSRTSSGTNAVVNYFQSYENIGQDSNNYSPLLYCPSKYIINENIGLISADEIVLAGGSYKKSNSSYFLYNSSIPDYYWTLSPAYYDPNQKNGNVFIVDKNGSITDWTRNLLTNDYYLRPVITINGNFEMIGDGTVNNPYTYK